MNILIVENTTYWLRKALRYTNYPCLNYLVLLIANLLFLEIELRALASTNTFKKFIAGAEFQMSKITTDLLLIIHYKSITSIKVCLRNNDYELQNQKHYQISLLRNMNENNR